MTSASVAKSGTSHSGGSAAKDTTRSSLSNNDNGQEITGKQRINCDEKVINEETSDARSVSFELAPMQGIGSSSWKGLSSKDYEKMFQKQDEEKENTNNSDVGDNWRNSRTDADTKGVGSDSNSGITKGDLRESTVSSIAQQMGEYSIRIESNQHIEEGAHIESRSSLDTGGVFTPTSPGSSLSFSLADTNPQLHKALTSNPQLLMQFAKHHLTKLRNSTAQIRPSEPESLKLLHVQILSLFNELYQVETALHKTQGKIKNVEREYSEVVGMVQREREERASLKKEVKHLKGRRGDLEKARGEMLSVLNKVGLCESKDEAGEEDYNVSDQETQEKPATRAVKIRFEDELVEGGNNSITASHETTTEDS
mmetsp:Transcript_8106/g.30065  ORF Transcript_8106/g.30065 Transcript_8106/m.30065 type:complete len:368 (-) Transcript_8106:43-1146(-)